MTDTPRTHELDVRPLLRAGDEPFGAIMAAADALGPGERLRLIAPFRPVPLFSVMNNRGFAAQDRPLEGGDWEVIFTPVEDPLGCVPEGAASEPGLSAGSAPGAVFWPDPARALDLGGLMPPEPMVRILETLAELAPGEVLFALLDREPVFLFPELAKRGAEWAGNFTREGDQYRLLIRAGDAP